MRTIACPACGIAELEPFYSVKGVPVHSVLLLPTRAEAVNYPTGDIVLGFCHSCGFVSNSAFAEGVHEYSDKYEETQGYSATFNAFARRLAERLIEQYDLRDKDVVEIGCGKGEFLTLLCELGDNRGVGIDPAYVATRSLAKPSDKVRFLTEFYSEERHGGIKADFVICKMTLEHIHDVANFVGTVRRALASQPDTTVFFQIPNATHLFKELGFWDVYYEHCSYFSPGSLARLFRRCGFDLINLWSDYGDQYLMIEAKPGSGAGRSFPGLEDDLTTLAADVAYFKAELPRLLQHWRDYLAEQHAAGRRVVLWGSGSKGVAFLTTLGITHEIECTVDINPNKVNMYMAGTGQRIVEPAYLRDYQPHVVIAMNPLYRDEIQRDLDRLGVSAQVLTVESAVAAS